MSIETYTKREVKAADKRYEDALTHYQELKMSFERELRDLTLKHDAAQAKYEENVRSCQAKVEKLEGLADAVVASADGDKVVLHKSKLIVEGKTYQLVPGLTAQIASGGSNITSENAGKMFLFVRGVDGESSVLAFSSEHETEYRKVVDSLPICIEESKSFMDDTASQLADAKKELAQAQADTAEIDESKTKLNDLTSQHKELDAAEENVRELERQSRHCHRHSTNARILRIALGVIALLVALAFVVGGVSSSLAYGFHSSLIANVVMIFILVSLGLWSMLDY